MPRPLENYCNVIWEPHNGHTRRSKHLWCAIDHDEIVADIGSFAPERKDEIRDECSDIFSQLLALDRAIIAYHNKLEKILVQAQAKVCFRAFLDDDNNTADKPFFRPTEGQKDVSQNSPSEENTTPTQVSPSSAGSSMKPSSGVSMKSPSSESASWACIPL